MSSWDDEVGIDTFQKWTEEDIRGMIQKEFKKSQKDLRPFAAGMPTEVGALSHIESLLHIIVGQNEVILKKLYEQENESKIIT